MVDSVSQKAAGLFFFSLVRKKCFIIYPIIGNMCDRAKSSSSEILEDSESTPTKDIKKSKVSEMNFSFSVKAKVLNCFFYFYIMIRII